MAFGTTGGDHQIGAVHVEVLQVIPAHQKDHQEPELLFGPVGVDHLLALLHRPDPPAIGDIHFLCKADGMRFLFEHGQAHAIDEIDQAVDLLGKKISQKGTPFGGLHEC